MKTVWRVDSGLLTLKEIEYNETMPLNFWLPVFMGDGEYAYFESYEEAKSELVAILDTKIEELVEVRNNIVKEKE